MAKATKKKTTKKTAKKKVKVTVKTTKKKVGRKTKYRKSLNKAVQELSEQGFTDKEIAEVFNVSESTINKWKKKYPVFMESMRQGKAIADHKVVNALYNRAIGYSHPDTHISVEKGDVTLTNIVKHLPPDVSACKYWLKNRMKKDWKDKVETEVTGAEGQPLPGMTINIIREPVDGSEE
jgi:hypothetical protein